MGSCFSCASTTDDAGNPPPTAKVITLTGALKEYSFPVKAAQALGTDHPSCFLCNSDKLYYDGYIPELHLNESLQLGQIYFVLPVAKRQYPLTGSDMAALAIKASTALALASGKGGRGKKIRIMPVEEVNGGVGEGDFDGFKRLQKGTHEMSRSRSVGKKMQRSASIRGRIVYRSFRARLGTIPEIAD